MPFDPYAIPVLDRPVFRLLQLVAWLAALCAPGAGLAYLFIERIDGGFDRDGLVLMALFVTSWLTLGAGALASAAVALRSRSDLPYLAAGFLAGAGMAGPFLVLWLGVSPFAMVGLNGYSDVLAYGLGALALIVLGGQAFVLLVMTRLVGECLSPEALPTAEPSGGSL